MKRFIILSRSRTGSTMLIDLIGSHPYVSARHEEFKEMKGRDHKQVIEQVFTPYWAHHVAVGCKLFYEHPLDTVGQPLWDDLIQDSSIVIIHLKRRNILRSVISHEISLASQKWSAKCDHERENVEEKCLRVDPEWIHKKISETEEDWKKIRCFEKHPVVDVWYEELVSERKEEVMAEVFQALGLFPVLTKSRYVQQNRETIEELVENFDELEAELHGSPYKWMLQDRKNDSADADVSIKDREVRDLIPRIIHYAWVGGALPVKYQHMIEEAQALNPDYQIKIWGDEHLPEFDLPAHILQLAQGDTGDLVFLSEVMKMCILQRYGGWYFDLDVRHLKPLSYLKTNGGVIDFVIPMMHKSFPSYSHAKARFDLNTWACAPGHPIPRRMYQEMIELPVGKTGVLWTQIIEMYMNEKTYIVNPFLMVTTEPARPLPKSITFHEEDRSWKDSEMAKRGPIQLKQSAYRLLNPEEKIN